MLERDYQAKLIIDLRHLFPGCLILKNDTDYMQGIPDLTIFYQDKYAMLEVKASREASMQPNQDYYIDLVNQMSFAAFIYPENEEEVIHALQRSFKSNRPPRVPKSKQARMG